jgi:hypothetical protein
MQLKIRKEFGMLREVCPTRPGACLTMGKQHVVLLFCHRSKPPQCPFGSCVTRRLHFLVREHVLQLILMHFPTEKTKIQFGKPSVP